MQIHFVVEGIPKAKGRHRSYVKKDGRIGTYTPGSTVSWENYIRVLAKLNRPDILMGGPVDLRLIFYMPIPKSWPKKKRDLVFKDKLFPTGKPDLDNMVKLVKDACNGIIWKDDKQVVYLRAVKYYSMDPRTEIIIEEI